MTDEISEDVNYLGRQLTRSDGKKKRVQLLEATLRVIIREGIRGVKHRAVAKEADVSLSSTTYYFRDIHDLITDAFMFFANQELQNNRQLKVLSQHAFNNNRRSGQLQSKEKLTSVLTGFILEHIALQIEQGDRRILEYVFQNEALYNNKLAEIMMTMQESTLNMIAQFFTSAGSKNAHSDTHIILACIRHIEYQLIVDKNLSINDLLVKQTIGSLVTKLLTDNRY